MGVAESSSGGVGSGEALDWWDQRCVLLFSVVVEVLDTELVRGLPRSELALSNGGRAGSGIGIPKLPAVLAFP